MATASRFAVDSLDHVAPELIDARQVDQAAVTALLVIDWNELHPGLKQAIQADLSSAWFMYGVLIILVAFSVLNTQLMSVLERTREFGVITALGIKPRKLASLVMLETMLMALIGLMIGVFLGWLVASLLQCGWLFLSGHGRSRSAIQPAGQDVSQCHGVSMMLGPFVVFLFCLLASIYPALRLYRPAAGRRDEGCLMAGANSFCPWGS